MRANFITFDLRSSGGLGRAELWGVDAIEGRQICRDEADREHLCGTYAARSLRSFLRDRHVTCNKVDEDRYGRAVAVCAVAGVEINEWLVRSGYAIVPRPLSRHSRSSRDHA